MIYLYRNNKGNYSLTLSPVAEGGLTKVLQVGGSETSPQTVERYVKILGALTNGTPLPVGASFAVQEEYKKKFPRPKLQHREIRVDGGVHPKWGKWHDLGSCGINESQAREVLAAGGHRVNRFDKNYIDLVREVQA